MKNKFELGGAKDLVYHGFHDVINLPKHSGLTIDEIIEADPDYVIWMFREGIR